MLKFILIIYYCKEDCVMASIRSKENLINVLKHRGLYNEGAFMLSERNGVGKDYIDSLSIVLCDSQMELLADKCMNVSNIKEFKSLLYTMI